jgi:hypothetical protein
MENLGRMNERLCWGAFRQRPLWPKHASRYAHSHTVRRIKSKPLQINTSKETRDQLSPALHFPHMAFHGHTDTL